MMHYFGVSGIIV